MVFGPSTNNRILVIDDNPDVRDDFRKILLHVDPLDLAEARLFGTRTPAAFDVDFASQGEEGLGLAQRARREGRPYAMAFVDVRMPPGWDGIETTRRLAVADPDLHFVICTAYSDYSWADIANCLSVAPERFLILKKPFEPIEVVQLAQAITDKWRLLSESRQAMANVIDSLPGIFCVLDDEAKLRAWNGNLERASGYPAAELLRLPLSTLLAATASGPNPSEICDALSHGRPVGDVALVTRDGGRVPYVWSGRSGWFNGAPATIVFGTDVSVLAGALTELRLKSEALNVAANAVAIADRTGTLVWVNDALTALTGYQRHELIGETPRLLKSGAHDAAFYARLWDTVLAGDVWRGEITNRRKDGTLYAEDMVITPVRDAGGEVAHFIAVKRDLTEEKRLQAELAQAQRMEVVGRLAGGIAHDFNNLLTVINGSAELALASGELPVAIRSDLHEIGQAGRRAAQLTRQLLAFSRKQVVTQETVSLTRLTEGMRGLLERLLGENITLAWNLEEALPVKADPGQLEQVVMNLVVNARDAMPMGGTLTVGVKNISGASEPGSTGGGHFVRLTVADTGIGMDAATRSHLFEPFFTTKEVGKGSGLGLATVHGIVKQSGGRISVESTPLRGSTFSVDFPAVADDRSPVKADPPDVPVATTPETVMVVEDEDSVRHMVTRILEASGYLVVAAGSGDEALRLLASRQGRVDLLLTDVVMPHMSGPDLAALSVRQWPKLKVLFTSGHTDNDVLRQSVFKETANFLGKPYSKRTLVARVREVLDQPADTHTAPAA
ncbi:MAG TPA: response regulator [Vicinamibacterales bacterium]|nr:response regulator [Vicinamibacterales bacterium]